MKDVISGSFEAVTVAGLPVVVDPTKPDGEIRVSLKVWRQVRDAIQERADDERKQELLNLVCQRGADGDPLLTTADFWRLWPDRNLAEQVRGAR
jgi:hypothetical protein